MSQTTRCVLLLCSFSSFCFAGPRKHKVAAENDNLPQINVRVYNYAEVLPAKLAAAKTTAARILRSAGIETAWFDCPRSNEELPRFPACQHLRGGPAVLQVKILPKGMAERIGAPGLVFGLSMIPKGGGLAFHTSIFYHRVEAIAKKAGLSRAVILGHILAHEIGHLLLGRDSHSPSGIMHVPWLTEELRLATQGSLLFTLRQAKRMRANAAERIRAGASGVAAPG